VLESQKQKNQAPCRSTMNNSSAFGRSTSAEEKLCVSKRKAKVAGLSLLALILSGCGTPPTTAPVEEASSISQAQKLREGDVIKIAFPSTPSLDAQQTIRPDGRITLAMLGELRVVDLTALDLEKELVKQYASQLVSNEVTVSVVSSSFVVFVSGAVNGPGKLQTDRPLTALEAILQGGGFTPQAKTTAVDVIRTENGKTKKMTLNLQKTLDGEPTAQFYLQPNDIVIVPQKFQWF